MRYHSTPRPRAARPLRATATPDQRARVGGIMLAVALLALAFAAIVNPAPTRAERGVLVMPHGYVYADESEAWDASGRFTYPVCVRAVADGFITYPCNASC